MQCCTPLYRRFFMLTRDVHTHLCVITNPHGLRYNTLGIFHAVLYVADTSVTVTSAPLTITVGAPPVVTITAPADPTVPFRGGDIITLVGQASTRGQVMTGTSLQVRDEMPVVRMFE